MLFLVMASAAAAAPRPYHLHETGRDVDYSYSWPAEVSAIPALNARVRADLARTRTQSARMATQERAATLKGGGTLHRHEFARTWAASGHSARLASFSIDTYEDTGGVHGNSGVDPLLWDRLAKRELPFLGLFAMSATPVLRPAFCRALAVQRAHVREGTSDVPEFNACPALEKAALIPVDKDRNGRFEAIKVIIDPYIAGPYAEGRYEVSLPVRPALLAALKPDYRSSFEAQRQ